MDLLKGEFKCNCLVTGGKGFIGSWLVNYLKGRGHYVRSVDVRPDSYLTTLEDEFLLLDLRERSNCDEALKGIDLVFNLAANMGGIGYISEYSAPIMHDNVLINVNLLDYSVAHDVSRYFFSSSACVYPRFLQEKTDLDPLRESDVIPAHPDSAYGWEKLFTEILCRSYMKDYDLEVRIARFHNIYGTHTTWKGGAEKAPAAICRKVAEAQDGSSITVWGDGHQTRSFLYVTDCCQGVYKLMSSNYSEPVNLGTDRLISIDDLAKMVISISGKNLTIKHDLSQPQGVRGRNADITLARAVLKWEPQTSLEEGMTKLYNWVSEQVHGR